MSYIICFSSYNVGYVRFCSRKWCLLWKYDEVDAIVATVDPFTTWGGRTKASSCNLCIVNLGTLFIVSHWQE